MDAGMCTICGEESFGTGSDHVRRESVAEVVESLWREQGRSYFQRHDYERLEATAAGEMIEALRRRLPALIGDRIAGSVVTFADDFSYTDPVDGSLSTQQGIRILLADESRIVCRLSGTGTEGATLRLYFERHLAPGSSDAESVLLPLIEAAHGLLRLRDRVGRDQPDVIT
jgi:phosphoglucomutase